MDFFEASEKVIYFFPFLRAKQNIMLIKNSRGPTPRIRQRRERQGTLSSYTFMSITQFIRLLQGRT